MKKSKEFLVTGLLICLLSVPGMAQVKVETGAEVIADVKADAIVTGRWVLAIHGGAGGPVIGTMPAEVEKMYKDSLNKALDIGSVILQNGGTSMDAVEAVVRFMENSPIFNAGRGAVLTEEGKVELDAAIMDGKSGKAGAVADVTTIRNPVTAARAVLEKTHNVLLVDGGAEQFATAQGLEMVDNSYFITPAQLEKWKKSKQQNEGKPENKDTKTETHGTVGAVALDQKGNLAAATSTGGIMNKMHGRVGDSPLIGAGTYANDQTCAVSASGTGEFFIRNLVAYDISALIEYKGLPVQEAVKFEINERLKQKGGDGGVIAIDRGGNIAMEFNTNMMFRGFSKSEGERSVNIYP